MAKILDRRKTIELRKLGKTYNEILQEVKVSKSTISSWLSSYPLTSKQAKLLDKSRKRRKYFSIEKVRITKQRKRESRLLETYKNEGVRWSSLNKKELELAGLFLYWGEGNKRLNGPISLNNTDPQVLKFTLYWLLYGLKIPRDKIRVYLHLYSDMDKKTELQYWSKELSLHLGHFTKPYIKESKRENVDHKGFGHGTCGLVVSNVLLKEKIMMGIKAIADRYSKKI